MQPTRRILLTHVGTSLLDCYAMIAAGNADFADWRDRLKRGEVPTGARRTKLITAWGDALAVSLAAIWAGSDSQSQKREKAPAEIASLQMLSASNGERVVLICSDTPDGVLSGEVLMRCLSGGMKIGFVPPDVQLSGVHPLAGVDVRSGVAYSTFIDEGLPAYMRLVADECGVLEVGWKHAQPSPDAFGRLVFNITGGYKGIIPFATLAAQVINAYPKNRERGIRAEVAYAHRESADQVLLTPDLPMVWAQEQGGIEKRYSQLHKQRRESGKEPTDPCDRMILALLDALEW